MESGALPKGMTEELAPEVCQLRDARSVNAWLMPDDPDLIELFTRWYSDLGEKAMGEGDFYALAAAVYYGPQDAELHESRWRDLTTYIELARYPRRRKRQTGRTGSRGSSVFTAESLPQLVFCYGLGIETPTISRCRQPLAGEDPKWADVWYDACWALQWRLIRLGDWLSGQLAKIGLPEVTFDPGQAKHLQGVLCGSLPCDCQALFRRLHPGCTGRQARQRHRKRHLLESWLNRSGWPKGRRYARVVYPISRFVFRAAVGDQPRHAKDLEKGLLFSNLRCGGVGLCVVRLLVCGQPVGTSTVYRPEGTHTTRTPCNHPLAAFQQCDNPQCLRQWPENKLVPWVIREGDQSYAVTEGKRCKRCGRYAPVAKQVCACGTSQFSSRKTTFYLQSAAKVRIDYGSMKSIRDEGTPRN